MIWSEELKKKFEEARTRYFKQIHDSNNKFEEARTRYFKQIHDSNNEELKRIYGENIEKPVNKPTISASHVYTIKELLTAMRDNTLSVKEKETAEAMIKVLEDYINGLSR